MKAKKQKSIVTDENPTLSVSGADLTTKPPDVGAGTTLVPGEPITEKACTTTSGSGAEPWKIRKPPTEAAKSLPFGLPDETKDYAGFWKRTAAHVIDWLIISMLGPVISIALLLVLSGSGSALHYEPEVSMVLFWYFFFYYSVCTIVPVVSGILAPMMTLHLAPSLNEQIFSKFQHIDPSLAIFIAVLMLGPWILDALYRSFMESSPKQATFGKMLLKLYVADRQGKRLTFSRALARHFCKLASGLPLMFGYLVATTGKQKDAWHDKLAGTHVIKAEWTPKPVAMLGKDNEPKDTTEEPLDK